MKKTTFLVLLVAGLIAAPTFGQSSITTTYAGGNSSGGNMFDVMALNDLTITGFDVNIGGTNTQMAVFFRQGSYLPFKDTIAGWTQAGTTVPVTSNGVGNPTPVPLSTCITIPAGQVYGLFVTTISGSMTYTNGTAQGALFTQDANIQIFEGHGGSYNGTTNPSMPNVPRVWNGTLYYTSPPVVGEWQVNSGAMSLDIDGASGGGCAPTIVSKGFTCPPLLPQTATLNLGSNMPGSAYDVVVSGVPIVPASSSITIGGEIVNVNVFQPFVWLSSGTATAGVTTFPSWFPGATNSTISGSFTLSGQSTTSMQGVLISGALPGGFKLSQAVQLDVNLAVPPSTIPGPSTVSGLTTVDVTAAPTCWVPGGIPFYGTTFSSMTVFAGGTIQFGGTDTDTSPSVLDAMNDDGRVGFWTGLDPSEGGMITISNPMPNILRADWNGVWYDAGGPGVTFGIQIDCGTGVIQIDGLGGLVPNPLTTSTLDDQWLGISPGITFPGTTNPGATPFAMGMFGGAVLPTDMLYEFNDISVSLAGLPASVMGGMTSLVFTPDGGGNYTWVGM